MIKKMLGLILGFVLLSYSVCQVLDSQDWVLVWQDEFETEGLPNPKKWKYDVGGHGWGNQELQYYTDARKENARVENGKLIIEARKEQYEGQPYTSARLVTKGLGDWTYGRFEIRAKVPRGKGTWPAIWMLPTVWNLGDQSWPDNGEIDIMEHVGFNPGQIHASTHCRHYVHHKNTQKTGVTQVKDAQDAFHNYIVEWDEKEIRAFVDDCHYFTSYNENKGWEYWPFFKDFHLVLNIAVGGSWGGMKGIDPDIFPQKMEIEYVRVYQKKNMLPPYKNASLPVEERVCDLVGRMTLQEKIALLGGTGFATMPIERLGIPELKMADGPVGVRWNEATALPSGIALASTWDINLAFQYGKILAMETRGKGRNVILGPCVNIARIPTGGRNFESFGEDPFLTSRIAVEYIKGVQSENVAATIKHFVVNNQEHQRDTINTKVDERTLREIYFPHFFAAVKEADVLAFMSAYNKLNGTYCSENDFLLLDVLKKEWGFEGLVMSDWGAVHSTIPTANGGLDLEMPNGYFLNEKDLLLAIQEGKVGEDKITDKVKRILRVMFKLGLFENPTKENPLLVNTPESRNLAYRVAADSIILLKNEKDLLPLKWDAIRTIALIGPNAALARTGGGGSSFVTPSYSVSPLQAFQSKLPSGIKLAYSQGVILDGDAIPIPTENLLLPDKDENGLLGEYFNNMNLQGEPILKRIDPKVDFSWGNQNPHSSLPQDHYSIRWTGRLLAPKTGEFFIDIASDDGIRFYIDDRMVIDDWKDHGIYANRYKISLEQGKIYKIKLEYYENGGDSVCRLGWKDNDDSLIEQAVKVSQGADVVLVFAGTSAHYESEGYDRENLVLPNNQERLIQEISKVNKNTIVILGSGSPVEMKSWIQGVSTLLQTWFGGAEMGNAIYDVLVGNVNPSGKTPITFPNSWEECSAADSYKKEYGTTTYSDGIFVGYRHYDHKNIMPLFPFGYGLSYTKFEYSGLILSSQKISEADALQIRCEVENKGLFDGQEVVQLYIRDIQASVHRPAKELKRFAKIFLKKGEKKTVDFKLSPQDLAFYDPASKKWVAEEGEFEIMIGSNSREIHLKTLFALDKNK
ncbi:MAG: glycoside hydrolase family 3 C-terminal domain-containing protein [Candidatus Brocadiae bacterium]|nr:glycoside hydrolase family 3 C-terminal domain-containing protein [Candidatus Brocadiia bacterium]